MKASLFLVFIVATAVLAETPNVVLGAHNIIEKEPGKVVMTAKYVMLHEPYIDDTLGNDIALVELPQDTLLINPFDKTYNNLQQAFDLQIVYLISEILAWNVSFIKTPLITNLNSYEENPDTWIVEQIINGSAEISSSTVVLTPDSENNVHYSFDIGVFRPQLYYKARSLREDYNIYLIPFSSQLWISLLATVFILMIFLTFILSREAKLPHEVSYDFLARIIDVQQDKDEFAQDTQITSSELLLFKEKWELGEILLIFIGAACQQGSARDPSTNAARILILCMFGLALIGYTAYSASVISFISLFPSTEQEQIKDLDYFTKEYKTLLYNINKIKDFHLNFTEMEFADLKKGFEKALEGDAVFAGDRDISLTFLHQQNYCLNLICTLGRTSFGMKYNRVLALKKNFNYTEKINQSILQMRQFGLLNHERRKIFHTESPCTNKEKLTISNFVSFSKKDVKPVLDLFTLGVIASLILLLMENVLFLCPKGFKKFLSKPTRKRHNTIKIKP